MAYYAVSGCIVAKAPWDCSNIDVAKRFDITSYEPENTFTRVAFKIDDKYYKLDTNGNLALLPTQAVGDSIVDEGNTTEELLALETVPGFLGKKVYPIIAMGALNGVTDYPRLKLGIDCHATITHYSYVEESRIYELSDDLCIITDVNVNAVVSGSASIVVEADLFDGENWSGYLPLNDIKGQSATKVRLRTTYTVEEIGEDKATLNNVSFSYRGTFARVNGEKAEVFTKTFDLYMDVAYVRTTIPHEKLVDADLKAYIALRTEPKKVEQKLIGIGAGVEQTIDLPDTGIDATTLKVYLEGVEDAQYDYNFLTNQITLTVPSGTNIFASYTCNLDEEKWEEMEKGSTELYQKTPELYNTDFYYIVPEGMVRSRAAIKYELIRIVDTTVEDLGTANGGHQIFKLQHTPISNQISVPNARFYFDNNGYLHLSAEAGTELKAEYRYTGTAPIIKEYTIAWNR